MHSLIIPGVEMPIAIQRVQPDRGKIELTDDAVARHWLKTFGVSRETLEAAIAKVGPNPETVKKELARQAANAGNQRPLPK